jgi:hypothetical protein
MSFQLVFNNPPLGGLVDSAGVTAASVGAVAVVSEDAVIATADEAEELEFFGASSCLGEQAVLSKIVADKSPTNVLFIV